MTEQKELDTELELCHMLKLELFTECLIHHRDFKSTRLRFIILAALTGILLIFDIYVFDVTICPFSLLLGALIGVTFYEGVDAYYRWKILKVYYEHKQEVLEIIRKLQSLTIQEDEA